MPSMGIGEVGKAGVIVKRKFRWTIELQTKSGRVPEHFCKLASRPKLTIDPTEINFLNATTWLPGKAKWEPISVTYIDVPSSKMQPLWDWIATVYDFQKDELPMSEKSGWDAQAILKMYDGCGSVLETWELKSLWPELVDFGDLDYASSEEATIELSLRYSEVRYSGGCGLSAPSGTCSGC